MLELLYLLIIIISLFSALFFLKLWGKNGLIIFYVVNIILSQLFVKLPIQIFGFTTIFGSIMFSVLFLSTDIITEHYGKKSGYQTVKIGVLTLIFFLIILQGALFFAPDSEILEAYKTLFGSQWRVVIADLLISYLIFQRLDITIYDKIHKLTGDKFLWLRNLGSTIISQTFTAILFFQIAFIGIIGQALLWEIIFTGLVMKIAISFLDTPFIYLSYKFLPANHKKDKR